MRHHRCIALALAVALATVATGGMFPAADILVANQLPDGSWGDPTWETGYMIAGLARVYYLSSEAPYKTSAELAGMYVLNHAPLIPLSYGPSTNPYNLLTFPNGSSPNTTTHNLVGEEAYGFRRLSEINAAPSGNIWRSEITNFYADVKALYPAWPTNPDPGNPGSTLGYIKRLRDANVAQWSEYSIVCDNIAHHVAAADYVNAADLAVWRSELISTLSNVTDNTAFFPVQALGAAVWALASTTGGLDNTPVLPSGAPVPGYEVWWDYAEWEPVELNDLPGILASHQDYDLLTDTGTGSFYWRFDHQGDSYGGPAFGYTEDTVFGTLGLQAASAGGYGSWDVQVGAGIYALLGGFAHWDNYMREHLWISSYPGYNFMYAGEALRLEIPEPGSMLLLGCGFAGLFLRKRRRTGRDGQRLNAPQARSLQ